jgi:hypothetical protein
MADTTSNFVEPSTSGGDFAADSPKGAVKRSGGSAEERTTAAPQDDIELHRATAYNDPHIGEGIQTIVDYVCGTGYNLSPRNIPYTGDQQTEEDISRLRKLLNQSNFWLELQQWVWYTLVDGTAFLELVVEDEVFDPRLLPTKKMSIRTDEFGRVEAYEMEQPEGEPIEYEPHEVAHLWFHKAPTDDFGRSVVERAQEQADILRDMEIDLARFIATKAYPPILWKLGTDEERWNEEQIEGWLDTVEEIEPDSMLAAGHDVDYETVGVTSTSSSSGAMRLEETFKHFERRMVTALGIPDLLMNLDGATGKGEAVANMPKFDRRITRLQNITKTQVEQQIFKSLMSESLEDFNGILPEFEFGEHSNAEDRLEIDKLLKLYNNGMLEREAFAERAGIDPEVELPSPDELTSEIIPLIKELAGSGDNIQNPEGGSPTATGGGAESAGGEVVSRDEPESGSSDGRNQQSVTQESA